MRHALAVLVALGLPFASVACTEHVVVQKAAPGAAAAAEPGTDETPEEVAGEDGGASGSSGSSSGSSSSGSSSGGGSSSGSSGSSSGGGWTPPASFTGIGSTVAACNGMGKVLLYGPGTPTTTVDVRTAWVFGNDAVTGRGNKIFGYTRPQVANKTLPLTGTVGEKQIRLSINSSNATLTPGAQYQGAIALSEWNAATSSWSTVAGSTSTALVFIESFAVDQTAWSDGHYCAGKISGHVESIADGTGATRLDFYFVAPLLTPSFPN